MKPGWQSNKLSEVIDQFIVPQRDKPKVFDGNVPWCRIEDFDGRYLVKSKSGLKVSDQLIKSMPLRVFPVDTVIVSCSADLGRCAIIKKPLVTNQTFIGLVPSNKIDSDFLYHLMTSMSVKLNNMASGATIKYLSKKKFQQIEILIPPLSEQKQIVEILDKAFDKIDKAIANIERNIENAKEMYESKLNEIFSNSCDDWSETKMVDLCDILTCGVASTPKYVDESIGIPFLSAQNVRNGKVVLHKYRYISKKLHEHLTKKNKPSKGDILYSRVGAKFGEAAVVEHDFEFSVYVSLTLIRPKAEKLYNYYLKHLLNSPSIKSLAKSSITSSGVPNLNVKSVRDFPIRYPNLSEQIRLVGTIDGLSEHIQSLMSNYREELKNLEELKKSILEKAFKGELSSAA